jgi:hypothetical protein
MATVIALMAAHPDPLQSQLFHPQRRRLPNRWSRRTGNWKNSSLNRCVHESPVALEAFREQYKKWHSAIGAPPLTIYEIGSDKSTDDHYVRGITEFPGLYNKFYRQDDKGELDVFQ